MLNLDTNIVLAFLAHSLRRDEARAMDDDPAWSISAIVLWELTKLFQKNEIEFGPQSPEFLDLYQRLHVSPLSLEVVQTLLRLDFKSDPADEVIAATSIVHGAPLVTRDGKMLASRLVPLAVS